jgi:hypothetical protein
MKTLFVCDEKVLVDHVGEEYDDIIEVPHQPTTENVHEFANRIKGRIRKLWAEDEDSDDRAVHVTLHGASPFNVMLINLRIIMKGEEGIVVELPYLSPKDLKPRMSS